MARLIPARRRRKAVAGATRKKPGGPTVKSSAVVSMQTRSAGKKSARASIGVPALPGVAAILSDLQRRGSPRFRDTMQKRFGIVGPTADTAFGISMAVIQKIASTFRRMTRDEDGRALHRLALDLWACGQYDARMLAVMIDDPALVTAAQMDAWCRDFDNWAICDTACFKLFDRMGPRRAFAKVRQWTRQSGEYQRRAAFALLASLALHDRETTDDEFIACLPLLERAAVDERNFVKKAVSWSMRSMGGRSGDLHTAMLLMSRHLVESGEPAARWIGKDVIRDITRPLVVRRAARGRRISG